MRLANRDPDDKEDHGISNTRLTVFKRCRLKYYWTYIDKQPQEEGEALLRGKSAHKALYIYYTKKSKLEAIEAAWEEYSPFHPASLEGMLKLDTILWRYFAWARIYDRWHVSRAEHTLEVEYKGIKLMGICDLIVRKAGKRFIVDHKFQKSHSFSHLDVDSQVSHYLALASLAGIKIQGLIYNIINLELGNTNTVALRQVASRTPQFIKKYLESIPPQVEEMKKLEEGKLAVYPNWTKDCCWDCGFYKQCVKVRK